MPIKGIVTGTLPECRVQNMIVGAEAYIDADFLTLTRTHLFIDRIAPVILKEDMTEEFIESDFAFIKRIGPGLTEADFELDLSALEPETLEIEPYDEHVKMMNNIDFLVVFCPPTIVKIYSEEVGQTCEQQLEYLNKELQMAVNNNDFKPAAKIRDTIVKIEEIKRKKEEANKDLS